MTQARPDENEPYEPARLSKKETDALLEAMGDGFGDIHSQDRETLSLPSRAREQGGLLDHQLYVAKSKYHPEEWEETAFWKPGPEDPAADFPLNFRTRRLRAYFENQIQRFCKKHIHELTRLYEEMRRDLPDLGLPPYEQGDVKNEMLLLANTMALEMPYQKPWYEFHAKNILDYIDVLEAEVLADELMLQQAYAKLIVQQTYAKLTVQQAAGCMCVFAGQLGRLVEQYYWRFRFEKSAVSGIGARKGASAGGKAKAGQHRAEHLAWQQAASKIWARAPGLSKMAVAEVVRKNLGAAHSAKHIARYIRTAPGDAKVAHLPATCAPNCAMRPASGTVSLAVDLLRGGKRWQKANQNS